VSVKVDKTKEQKQQLQQDANKTKAVVIQAPMKDVENVSKDGTYYIQVGSFTGKPQNNLIKKIKSKRLHYRLIKFDIGKKHISKLLIGPYKTHQDAQMVLEKIRVQIQPSAFIAEIR